MITNVTTMIRSAFSSFASGGATVQNPNASAARRVGPQRVIFIARLNGVGTGVKSAEICLGMRFRVFPPGNPAEELVTVLVDQVSGLPEAAPILEKRATLKVKPGTKFLSVAFVDNAGRVCKSERIRIK